MRVYLTGADGLLGTALTAALTAHEVTAGWQVHGVSARDFDISDATAVRRSVADVRPHLIVHAAANAVVDDCEADPAMATRVNVDGTRHVTEAARRHGSRLVYVSSDYVFDGRRPPARGYRENDVPGPVNIYGLTKLAGERIAACVPAHLVIRTSWLFGGRDESTDQLRGFVRRSLGGEPSALIGDQVSGPTYAVHLARAMIHLLARRPDVTGVVHIANGGSASWYEVGRVARDHLGALGALPEGPDAVAIPLRDAGFVARRPLNSSLNTDRLKGLGLRMPRWEAAVRECCTALVAELATSGR